MTSPFKQKIMAAAVFDELRERVRKHREAYGLEFFPNSETLDDRSSRDSVGAKMGRHMCDCFERYMDETQAESVTLLTRLVDEVEALKAALERMKTLTITDGCEECSAVWQREYVPNTVREALAAHQKRWEDLK